MKRNIRGHFIRAAELIIVHRERRDEIGLCESAALFHSQHGYHASRECERAARRSRQQINASSGMKNSWSATLSASSLLSSIHWRIVLVATPARSAASATVSPGFRVTRDIEKPHRGKQKSAACEVHRNPVPSVLGEEPTLTLPFG